MNRPTVRELCDPAYTLPGLRWSRPHYGVQHLGSGSPRRYWCTVEDHGTFAVLTRWTPGCGFSAQQETFPDAASARVAGLDWLRQQPTGLVTA